MAKLIDKKDCTFEKGYIIHGDEIVRPSHAVWEELYRLEVWLQKTRYLEAQPEACPPPSLEDFEFTSSLDKTLPKFEDFETPNLDEAVEFAKGIFDEVKGMQLTKEANAFIRQNPHMFEFVGSDKFVDCSFNETGPRFDMYLLGNPLELTTDDLMHAVGEVFASKFANRVTGCFPIGEC